MTTASLCIHQKHAASLFPQNMDRNCIYDRLRHASWSKDNKALQMALKDYGIIYHHPMSMQKGFWSCTGTELVSQVGIEVDRLEEKIRRVVPGDVLRWENCCVCTLGDHRCDACGSRSGPWPCRKRIKIRRPREIPRQCRIYKART